MKNKIKLGFLFILFFVIIPNVGVAENATYPLSGKVIKNIERSDNLYIEKIATYFIEQDGCSICWEVSVDRDDKKIRLSSKQPIDVKCTFPFVKQLPLHRKIFIEIFRDWQKDRFHILFMGPLSRLDPANRCNMRIAMAAAKSPDWIDWRKNYPNHSTGKTINQIFVELAKLSDAYTELAGLFEEFGLKIELNSVEKVFAKKAKDLAFYQELNSHDIEGDHRLIYDAGMIYFSVSQVN